MQSTCKSWVLGLYSQTTSVTHQNFIKKKPRCIISQNQLLGHECIYTFFPIKKLVTEVITTTTIFLPPYTHKKVKKKFTLVEKETFSL